MKLIKEKTMELKLKIEGNGEYPTIKNAFDLINKESSIDDIIEHLSFVLPYYEVGRGGNHIWISDGDKRIAMILIVNYKTIKIKHEEIEFIKKLFAYAYNKKIEFVNNNKNDIPHDMRIDLLKENSKIIELEETLFGGERYV